LWDVNTGECLDTLEGHENWIRSVVFSPDGKRLASGSADETIRFWDVKTRKEIGMPLISDRPYEGMNITGIKGDVDIAILKALGAVTES
ncbi:MAG: WD40 repeat domain-containing protein, partial [Microcystis panniformis]